MMKQFTIKEVSQATGAVLVSGRQDNTVMHMCTDSREAMPGDLFFPLIGENNDGHDYLNQVIEKGCRSIIVSDLNKVPPRLSETFGEDINILKVEDTTKALQDLARYYLGTMPLKKKIAVTGSVGKTSTRDMLYYVAKTRYKTSKNKKNYNNAFGLPLSILDFDPDTEVAVLEMGMSAKGEIDKLAELVRPDIAVITNIGISHIENLGSREGILNAKMEVTSFFNQESTLIVNSDCDLLDSEHVAGNYNLITVGTGENCDYTVSNICDFGDKGIKYTLGHNDRKYDVQLAVPGAHNAINGTLAIVAGDLLNISLEDAIKGLEQAELTDKRLNIKTAREIKVIDDTYNACPESIKSAINTLSQTQGKRRIAIIGDMFELGDESANAHRDVGKFAAQKGVDMLIAVGDIAKEYVAGAGKYMDKDCIFYFPETSQLKECINCMTRPGDVILVKASRGMALEKIVEEILNGKE